MRTLECSSKGDKRFSAFYAHVSFEGKTASIEHIYQTAKRFGDEPVPKHWKDGKGRKPTHFHVNNKDFDLTYLPVFYDLLWYLYLMKNPTLIDVLKQYDAYHDMFRSKNSNVCQADSITLFMKDNGQTILNNAQEFLTKYHA